MMYIVSNGTYVPLYWYQVSVNLHSMSPHAKVVSLPLLVVKLYA